MSRYTRERKRLVMLRRARQEKKILQRAEIPT
jgi:hypothetical protein